MCYAATTQHNDNSQQAPALQPAQQAQLLLLQPQARAGAMHTHTRSVTVLQVKPSQCGPSRPTTPHPATVSNCWQCSTRRKRSSQKNTQHKTPTSNNVCPLAPPTCTEEQPDLAHI